MSEKMPIHEGEMPRETSAGPLHPEIPSRWEALQVQIAWRADELSRAASPFVRQGSGRLLWMKAENEILGAGSRIAIWSLFDLAARLSRGPNKLVPELSAGRSSPRLLP
jgi:hypothetical protein